MHTLYRNPENKSPCFIIHNAFAEDVCKQIIEKYKDKVFTGTHVTSKGFTTTESEIRNSDIVWMQDENGVQNALQQHVKVANHCTGWDLDITAIEDIQFTKYESEQHYSWHVDGKSCTYAKRGFTFDKPKGLAETCYPHLIDTCRKVSASLILNDDFSGGEFETAYLHNDEKGNLEIKKHIHKPKKGDMLIFPSYLHHRVRPVRTGIRYSIVVWAGGPPMK